VSKRKSKRERSGSKTTSDHPRDIAELAALVVSSFAPHEPGGEENGTLMIFVWQDCAMTIKFPSGRRMYVQPGDGQSLDSTVHEIAVQAITKYCQGAGIAVAEIRVHMVPPEASTSEQIFAWFQSMQKLEGGNSQRHRTGSGRWCRWTRSGVECQRLSRREAPRAFLFKPTTDPVVRLYCQRRPRL